MWVDEEALSLEKYAVEEQRWAEMGTRCLRMIEPSIYRPHSLRRNFAVGWR